MYDRDVWITNGKPFLLGEENIEVYYNINTGYIIDILSYFDVEYVKMYQNVRDYIEFDAKFTIRPEREGATSTFVLGGKLIYLILSILYSELKPCDSYRGLLTIFRSFSIQPIDTYEPKTVYIHITFSTEPYEPCYYPVSVLDDKVYECIFSQTDLL